MIVKTCFALDTVSVVTLIAPSADIHIGYLGLSFGKHLAYFDISIVAWGSNSCKEYQRTQSGLICSSCVRVGEVNRDLGERGSEWDGGMESKLLTKSK